MILFLGALLSFATAQTQTNHRDFCAWLLGGPFGQNLFRNMTDLSVYGAVEARLKTMDLLNPTERASMIERIEHQIISKLSTTQDRASWTDPVELIKYARRSGDHARAVRWLKFLVDLGMKTRTYDVSSIKALLVEYQAKPDSTEMTALITMVDRVMDIAYRTPFVKAALYAGYGNTEREEVLKHIYRTPMVSMGHVPKAEDVARLTAELRGFGFPLEEDLELTNALRSLGKFVTSFEAYEHISMLAHLPPNLDQGRMRLFREYLTTAAWFVDESESAVVKLGSPRGLHESAVDYAARLTSTRHRSAVDYASAAQASSIGLLRNLIGIPSQVRAAANQIIGLRPSVAQAYLFLLLAKQDLRDFGSGELKRVSEQWSRASRQAADWALRYAGGQEPMTDGNYYFFDKYPTISVLVPAERSHMFAEMQLKNALMLAQFNRPELNVRAEHLIAGLSESAESTPGQITQALYEEPFASTGAYQSGDTGSSIYVDQFVPLDFKINAWIDLAKAWPARGPELLDRATRLDQSRPSPDEPTSAYGDQRNAFVRWATQIRLSRELIKSNHTAEFGYARKLLDQVSRELGAVQPGVKVDLMSPEAIENDLRRYVNWAMGARLAAIAGGDRVVRLRADAQNLGNAEFGIAQALSLIEGAEVMDNSDFTDIADDLLSLATRHVLPLAEYHRLRFGRRLLESDLPPAKVDARLIEVLQSLNKDPGASKWRNDVPEQIHFWREILTHDRVPRARQHALEALEWMRGLSAPLRGRDTSYIHTELLRNLIEPRRDDR